MGCESSPSIAPRRATTSASESPNWVYTPVGLGTQELRAATAMTGGVSLAIWMGGVAREINLLEQASRHRESIVATSVADVEAGFANQLDGSDASARILYLRLLDLLDVTVSFDMLSGTSAGGINAALLGFTRARSADLGPLRDVWLETGSFDLLLRDPSEKRPPSLLQGDGVLLAALEQGLNTLSLRPSGAKEPTPPPTKVFITTTLLTGETSRFADSYGTLVQDVDHRGLFVFDQDQLADDTQKAALALAARCSASFPAAFEPAYVPYGERVPARGRVAEHADMQPYANTTRAHFASDGGLLMNRPINPLLQAIFDRTAERQVRRVLLYVVPSPGDAPDPTHTTPHAERFDDLPTFVQALLKDLGAVLKQSISADLRALREQNDRVEATGDARLRVAELGSRLGTGLLTPSALADYRARESATLARTSVTSLMRALTTMPTERMPSSWSDALKPGGAAEGDCQRAAEKAVADGWPASLPLPVPVASIAAFGRGPYDGAKATALAMLRAGWILASAPDDRTALAGQAAAVHGCLSVPKRAYVGDLVADELATIDSHSATTLANLASSVAKLFARSTNPEPAELVEGWQLLATAVLHATPILTRLAAVPSEECVEHSVSARRSAAAMELVTYLAYLGAPDNAQTPVDATISRLFELHVVVRSMLPVATAIEQPIELVQVSADTRNLLAPKRSTANDKLTGVQMHHFGAFYKSSWRANDWMWGRLDGAGWLVHLLLDPRRILVVTEGAAAHSTIPAGTRANWFLARLVERIPHLDPSEQVEGHSDRLEELAYLDDHTVTMPASLPEVALWVASVWQRHVTVAELPVVARESVATPTLRTSEWAVEVLKLANVPESIVVAAQSASVAVTSGHWTREQQKLQRWASTHTSQDLTGPQADAVVAKLRDCPVPSEKLGAEIGEPLFTRTVTKATAVAAAATAEADEMPTALRPVFATLRTATLLAYRLAAVTRGWPRRVFAVGVGVFAVGVAVAAFFGSLVGVSGVVLATVGVFLMLLAAWRSFAGWLNWVKLVLLGLVLACVVVLATDSGRSWLFGHSRSDVGALGRQVLPWIRHDLPDWVQNSAFGWLRDSWWHAPVLFCVLAFLLLTCGYLLARRLRRHRSS